MRLVLLILALLASYALAQNSGSSLPDGATACANATSCGPFPTTQCVTCADGTLGSCYRDACIVNDNGGCSWYQRPPCKTVASIGSQPTTCPDPKCESACEYGRVNTASGCPTCECNPAPVCNTACTDAACNPETQVYVPPAPGSCCGSCQNKVSGCAPCPAISCPPSSEGTTYGLRVDSCGCKVCVAVNCTGIACPDLACVAPLVAYRTADGCCPICRLPPTCANTACPALACAIGFHSIVRDGDCCPTCVPNPPSTCNRDACPKLSCPSGSEPKLADGACCPTCSEVDCDAILCPNSTASAATTEASVPLCNPIFINERQGACCKSCSPCRRLEDGLVRCTINDEPVCAPGLATGDGKTCTPIPKPNVTEVCKEFTVVVELTDANVAIFAAVQSDNAEGRRVAKYALLRLVEANTDAATQAKIEAALEHLSVTILRRSGKEVRVKVCWTADASDSSVDTAALASSTEQALTTAGVQPSSAAAIVPAVLLVFAAVAMLF